MTEMKRFETLSEVRWQPEVGFFDEPSSSRTEGYRPWETTPVSEDSAEVRVHQGDVNTLTYNMLGGGSYPYRTRQLEDYVSLMYYSREANRKAKNAQSYHNNLSDATALDAATEIKRLQMIDGKASPDSIRQVRKARKQRSAELAKLTHIWGYRLEHIEPMRMDVLKDVEASGGIIHENPTEKYAIIAADNSITHNNKLSFALTMKRIRHIATIGTAKDIERSSFIVILNNQTRLDPTLIKQLKSIKIHGDPEDEAGNPSEWAQAMMDLGLGAEVKKHLDSNDFETIVPMSTTIFEDDPTLKEEIYAQLKARESIGESDVIKEARENYIKSLGGIAMFDKHGMGKN